jgi:hypothetical protein
MNPPTGPTPPTNGSGFDSLTTDILLADDRGGTTLLPADPDALARFLAERRRLEAGSSAKEREPNS